MLVAGSSDYEISLREITGRGIKRNGYLETFSEVKRNKKDSKNNVGKRKKNTDIEKRSLEGTLFDFEAECHNKLIIKEQITSEARPKHPTTTQRILKDGVILDRYKGRNRIPLKNINKSRSPNFNGHQVSLMHNGIHRKLAQNERKEYKKIHCNEEIQKSNALADMSQGIFFSKGPKKDSFTNNEDSYKKDPRADQNALLSGTACIKFDKPYFNYEDKLRGIEELSEETDAGTEKDILPTVTKTIKKIINHIQKRDDSDFDQAQSQEEMYHPSRKATSLPFKKTKEEIRKNCFMNSRKTDYTRPLQFRSVLTGTTRLVGLKKLKYQDDFNVRLYHETSECVRVDFDHVPNATQRSALCVACGKYACNLHGLSPPLFAVSPKEPPPFQQSKLMKKFEEEFGQNIVHHVGKQRRKPCGAGCCLNKSSKSFDLPWEIQERIGFFTKSFGFSTCQITMLLHCEFPLEKLTCRAVHAVGRRLKKPPVKNPENLTMREFKNAKNGLLMKHGTYWPESKKEKEKFKKLFETEYQRCRCEKNCDGNKNCPCSELRMCSPYCGCKGKCSIKFKGCRCPPGQCGTMDCPCFAFHRECDPRFCTSCNAHPKSKIDAGGCSILEKQYKNHYRQADRFLLCGRRRFIKKRGRSSYARMLLNMKKLGTHDEEEDYPAVDNPKNIPVVHNSVCNNTKVTYGIVAKTKVGKSTYGLGLFAAENIKVGSYIGEYTGSIITQERMIEREKIYSLRGVSYSFNLSEKLVVDADKYGNKTRFANSQPEDQCNLTSRTVLVTDFPRIGIFATCDIKKDQELFLHYPITEKDKEANKTKQQGASRVRKAEAAISLKTSKTTGIGRKLAGPTMKHLL